MRNIKVYLQYPWKFPDSPYYKYLIENPPEGIEYTNIENQTGVITNKSRFIFSKRIKEFIRRYTNKLRLVLLNIRKTKPGNYDLIHCAHCLSKNKSPWVADFEDFWQFWISGAENKKGIKPVRKVILNKYCKKIIAWTEEGKRRILRIFPEIKDKIEVVYPAVPLFRKDIKHNAEESKIHLAFIGRYFYRKGGLHVVEVFNRIAKKNKNVECFFVSDTPDEIIQKYKDNKKIHFLKVMPQKELFAKVLEKTDIFVYPGYSDTFGFALLEAMSWGIPSVTVDGFAKKEIIEDGRTGFVIPKKFEYSDGINELDEETIGFLVDKTSVLIKNSRLRRKMARNCIEEIKTGKFSIEEKNKNLRRIYDGALNENQ